MILLSCGDDDDQGPLIMRDFDVAPGLDRPILVMMIILLSCGRGAVELMLTLATICSLLLKCTADQHIMSYI